MDYRNDDDWHNADVIDADNLGALFICEIVFLIEHCLFVKSHVLIIIEISIMSIDNGNMKRVAIV